MKRLIMTIAMMTAVIASFAQKADRQKGRVADHVIWIGIDGFGSYAFDPAYNVDIPNIRSLMANGSWTTDARTVLPTVSGYNWMSMFTGVPPCLHGQLGNDDGQNGPVAYKDEHGMYPTIFHVVRKAFPEAEIGVQHEWSTIKYLVDSLDVDHLLRIHEKDADVNTPNEAAKYIKEKKPNLFFMHIDQLDHTGHGAGHRTPEYFATLHSIDAQIGKIIQAVKDAGIYDNTIFIITSDHGGQGSGHGGETLGEMQVPVVYCGKGIKKNNEVKDVVVQFDVANTVARIFNIEAPECWRGRVTDVFK